MLTAVISASAFTPSLYKAFVEGQMWTNKIQVFAKKANFLMARRAHVLFRFQVSPLVLREI